MKAKKLKELLENISNEAEVNIFRNALIGSSESNSWTIVVEEHTAQLTDSTVKKKSIRLEAIYDCIRAACLLCRRPTSYKLHVVLLDDEWYHESPNTDEVIRCSAQAAHNVRVGCTCEHIHKHRQSPNCPKQY